METTQATTQPTPRNEEDLVTEILNAPAKDIEDPEEYTEEEEGEEDDTDEETEEAEDTEEGEAEGGTEQDGEDDGEDGESEGEAEEEPEQDREFLEKPYYDTVKGYFPDREFNSTEDLDAAVEEMIATQQKTIEEDQKANESLIEMFEANPRMMKLAQLLIQGVPDRVAFWKAGFSPEDFDADEDEPEFEQVVLAKHESKKQREQARQERERIARNAENSKSTLTEFQKNKRLNDAEYGQFTGWVEGLVNSLIDADLNNQMLEKLYQGYIYQEAVKNARQQGEVEGRNQKIKVEKKRQAGDGLPRLHGRTEKSEVKRYADPFVEALDSAIRSL
jgi:hypothetical protein